MSIYTPKDFSSLIGTEGLSDTLLSNHFTLYEGYVKNVNALQELLITKTPGTPEHSELKRRFGWEWNGMRLHELYFENLRRAADTAGPTDLLREKIEASFGTFDAWQNEFFGIALMRGIGWVVLTLDETTGQLFNTWINEHDGGHLAGSKPLLVLDVFEHAYMTDYGIKRADYVAFCKTHIDWNTIGARLIA
ncbi:MAG: superoxide dismutase, Fe-Mn family [Patescibacteria group bacterium]|nr:superoxide dismutase, Fe-Mn family [Patescibacteria group bacterium]